MMMDGWMDRRKAWLLSLSDSLYVLLLCHGSTYDANAGSESGGNAMQAKVGISYDDRGEVWRRMVL